MAIYRGSGGSTSTTDQATIDQVADDAATATTKAAEAATSATAAASSASSASSSATSATSSASTATTKASEASTSATNAASSATAAASSATSAASSATSASGSATNAATSASSATTSAANAASSETAAETAESNAQDFASDAQKSAYGAVDTLQTLSDSSTLYSARHYASKTGADKDAAAASAAAAATSETNAATSETNAQTAYDDFAARYRVQASAPTTSLDSGDLWWNTSQGELRAYDTVTSSWAATAPSAEDQIAINIVAGDVVYIDDLGLITDTVDENTGTGNINTVATNIANVNTVAGISGNVTTVAGISGNVTTVATNNSNVTTVATNIADVNTFAVRYRIGSSDPSTDNDAGDLFFNTTANLLKYYDGSSWNTITVGIGALSDDTTPTLAANLNADGNNLTNVGTIDGTNLSIDFGSIA